MCPASWELTIQRKNEKSRAGIKKIKKENGCSVGRCEDVKKRLRLLREERLLPREVKTCVFVCH